MEVKDNQIQTEAIETQHQYVQVGSTKDQGMYTPVCCIVMLNRTPYSEVVVNVIDLALNWQLFSNVGRPQSFVNVMSMNSTLDPVSTVRMLL